MNCISFQATRGVGEILLIAMIQKPMGDVEGRGLGTKIIDQEIDHHLTEEDCPEVGAQDHGMKKMIPVGSVLAAWSDSKHSFSV